MPCEEPPYACHAIDRPARHARRAPGNRHCWPGCQQCRFRIQQSPQHDDSLNRNRPGLNEQEPPGCSGRPPRPTREAVVTACTPPARDSGEADAHHCTCGWAGARMHGALEPLLNSADAAGCSTHKVYISRERRHCMFRHPSVSHRGPYIYALRAIVHAACAWGPTERGKHPCSHTVLSR